MSFIESLLEYAESNKRLIKIRESDDGRFRVLKYSKMTHYKSVWNEYTRECRGLVIDKDNNIISYPFSKFFNLNIEKNADKFDENEVVYAIRKINGFLAIVSKYNGELVINTAGSFNSEFVDKIKHYIDESNWLSVLDENYTYMFECVVEDENADHVTKEKEGLTLLGYREKVIGSPLYYKKEDIIPVALKLKCNTSDYYIMPLCELVKMCAQTVDHEGFVIYAMDGSNRMAKIKSRKFLTKRFLAGLTDKSMDRILDELHLDENLDEEFVPLVRHIISQKEQWSKMTHLDRVRVIKKFI